MIIERYLDYSIDILIIVRTDISTIVRNRCLDYTIDISIAVRRYLDCSIYIYFDIPWYIYLDYNIDILIIV